MESSEKQCLDLNVHFVARHCLTEDRQAVARLSDERCFHEVKSWRPLGSLDLLEIGLCCHD